jgi:hypothetical protein
MRKSNRYWLRRELRANLRDTLILIRQFFWPLLAFSATLVFGGLLYYRWGISPRRFTWSYP